MWNEFWVNRGTPAEYDPGPPANTDWSELFARTPNYRAIGEDRLGREAFRWHFGPMFYRGRLERGEARVLVVGQEGAQDESIAHRSFVGGSGGKMQHFLGWLGITRSYLFLNTFVYPIFGQYSAELRPLAQHADSPIVQHRHAIFEHLASINQLELVVSVGTAAREAIATWVRMRGGSLPAGARSIHVLHPGAAAAGSATQVRESFVRAVRQIGRWVRDNPGWLRPDADGNPRFDTPYLFRAAPIPFRDLPFGIPWRIGNGGTSSNRRDGQTAIQLFSADGKYNNQGHALTYPGSAGGSRDGYADESGDLPYEPPRREPRAFDPGPGAAFARLLSGTEPGFDWPDFAALGLPAHPSFGFGASYRGRPASAVVYVIADQESHDDLFASRALCGESGQRFQRFLRAAGLTRSYLIVRTLPVNAIGATAAKLNAALEDARVIRLHTECLARATSARVLVAIGPGAQRVAARANQAALPVVSMPHWTGSASAPAWRQALEALRDIDYAKDAAASFELEPVRGQVSRIDLPFGTLRWQGSSGSRVLQARQSGTPSRDYFKIVMPRWAADLDAEPL